MSKKIIDLGFGIPNDASLGFIGDPSSGALSKATYLTLKNYFQSGSSLLLSGSFVTTSSFNTFTASYRTDSASFDSRIKNVYASESNYTLSSSFNTFTSSYFVDSASFDSRIKNIAASASGLTGSFLTRLEFSVYSASNIITSASFDNRINNIFASESNYLPSASFNTFTASYLITSASVNNQLTNIFLSESGYVRTSSFNTFTASYVNDSSSFNIRINNIFASESNYVLTSSIQGNTNYIPVFSASNTLVQSNFFQSGSSLLIGTVTGQGGAILQVAGDVSINGTGYLKLPTGTTAQRPTGSAAIFGMIRGNSDTINPEFYNGVAWVNFGSGSGATGSGSVTSVGLSLPSIFTVSNSPIVGAGVLSASLNVESASTFLAAPVGSTGVPTFRSLTIADIASLTSSFIGNFVTTSSFNTFTSSYFVDSASFDSRIKNVYASESNYTLSSSFNTFTSSYFVDSASFDNRINNVYLSESNYITSSSFNNFSGSYVNDSGSFNTRISNTLASESNLLPTSSVRGIINYIPVFSGVTSFTSSILYQSGSSVIIGSTTGSNNSIAQISGNLSVNGQIFDSTNSTGSSGQVLANIGSGIGWISTGSGFWNLSGNSISSGSFIGTTNAQDLILKRNNIQVAAFFANNSLIVGNPNNTISGSNSFVAAGSNNTANAMASVINGNNNIAIGNSSTVLGGQNNISIGVGSAVLGGTNLSASAAYTIVGGRFNDPISSSNNTTWVGGDPLFILGNGSSTSSLSNALVIYKTGSLSLSFYKNNSGSVLSVDSNGNVINIPYSVLTASYATSASFNAYTSSANTQLTNLNLSQSKYLTTASFSSSITGSIGFVPLFLGNNSFTSSVISQSTFNTNSGYILSIGSSTFVQGGSNFVSGGSGVVIGTSNALIAGTVHPSDILINGRHNTASGDTSHAEGFSTYAYGFGAHSEGFLTTAYGDFSYAAGIGTIASGSSQYVVGKYNIPAATSSSLFIVGNGNDPFTQSNAMVVGLTRTQFMQDVYITGSLHVSGALFDSTDQTGFFGQVLSSTGTGVAWTNVSGSSLFSGYLTTASYLVDSASFDTRIKSISSSIQSLTGSYVTVTQFNTYTSSAASKFIQTSSLQGATNFIPVFNGSNSITGSIIYQSGSSVLIGRSTGSNNASLQVFGNIYVSKSLFDSTNSTGSANQILTSTATGIKWVNTGSGGTSVLNFIIGDGGPFTPISGSSQFSGSGNPLVGRTVLQFFQEGALLANVPRAISWYTFTSSQGIINLNNATFDLDTFYSVLYI